MFRCLLILWLVKSSHASSQLFERLRNGYWFPHGGNLALPISISAGWLRCMKNCTKFTVWQFWPLKRLALRRVMVDEGVASYITSSQWWWLWTGSNCHQEAGFRSCLKIGLAALSPIPQVTVSRIKLLIQNCCFECWRRCGMTTSILDEERFLLYLWRSSMMIEAAPFHRCW